MLGRKRREREAPNETDKTNPGSEKVFLQAKLAKIDQIPSSKIGKKKCIKFPQAKLANNSLF